MNASFPFIFPVNLTTAYHVHDFVNGCKNGQCNHDYSIGRYNENRDFYISDFFAGRSVHLGIDFGAPAGTEVLAVSDCTIFYKKKFSAAGDYGPMLVTKNILNDQTIYCLYAHLQLKSFDEIKDGQFFRQGQKIHHIGAYHENGQWPPHLHFQVCKLQPIYGENIPGTAHPESISEFLLNYPDPQLYFGPLY